MKQVELRQVVQDRERARIWSIVTAAVRVKIMEVVQHVVWDNLWSRAQMPAWFYIRKARE